MKCDTKQILEGSELTFESVIQICDIGNLFNPTLDTDSFVFRDKLQNGLIMPNDGGVAPAVAILPKKVKIEYNGTKLPDGDYNAVFYIEDVDGIAEKNEVVITITDITTLKTLTGPVLLKITLIAKVDDVDAVIDANNGVLNNTATFQAFNATTPTSKAVNVALENTPIEKYSIAVGAYSLNACPVDKNFNAELCFNTPTGNYGDIDLTTPETTSYANYVLTIKPTTGVSIDPNIEKDDITISTGCCCEEDSKKITNFSISQDSTTGLKITIPYTTVDAATTTEPATVNMCGKLISVSIPYILDSNVNPCPSICPTDPITIKGSIELQNVKDEDNPVTLEKLENFGLYVNIDCDDIIGVSKTILC